MTRYILLALILGFTAVPLTSQIQGNPSTFSLDDCIKLALEYNVDVRANNAQYQFADASKLQAIGAYLPSASFSANYNRQLLNVNNGIPSFINGTLVPGAPRPNTYSLQATSSLVLFNGMQREAQYDRAVLGQEALTYDTRITRMNVISAVTRQYYAVLRAKQVLQARKEAADLSTATLERIKGLVVAGRSPITEQYSQEAEAANQTVSILQAELSVARATADLLTTMGLDADMPASFMEGVVPTTITPADLSSYRKELGSDETRMKTVIDNRPDLVAADIRSKSAEAAIVAAKSTYYPTVLASSVLSWSNFEIKNFDTYSQWYVGLSLRVPLFDQFQTNYNVENANISLTQTQLDREKLEQQIRSGYRTAMVTLNNTERGLTITEIAQKAAQINYDATRERFNLGSATLLDVQTANNQLVTARINRITAIYDYYDARAVVDLTLGNVKDR